MLLSKRTESKKRFWKLCNMCLSRDFTLTLTLSLKGEGTQR